MLLSICAKVLNAGFKFTRDNNAQIRLIDETHSTLTTLAQLNREYGYDICVQNSVPTIAQMNELALIQDDPDVAFNLVEAAHHLASMAKIMATKMKTVALAIAAVGDKLAKSYVYVKKAAS